MTGRIAVAERFARAAHAVRGAELPPQVHRVASDLVLDVAGLCVAARRTDYVLAALQSIDTGGTCTAIGHAGSFDAAGAALINGIAAHGEDYDDTFEGGPVHAGAVIVPAVLATAERFGAAGAAMLAGIAVGAETMCRLSLVAPMRVHKAGFHPTSVFGALGSAAAVATTLGLNEAQIVDALGIAASMAGGIIEYLAEGAWTKRLHAGWAAQSGIRAALLARGGFVGPRTVFEGTHGLFFGFAHTNEADFERLTSGFGDEWVTETLAFKPYACGTMIHPYIDCAIRLAARGIRAEEIAEIVCETAEGIVHRLWEPLADKQAPPNPYAAKFSTPFCIALGFVLGDVGLGAFTAEAIDDPKTRALAAKVRYEIDPHNPYPRSFTGHLRATLVDGRVIEERQPHFRGGAKEPLTREAIEAKYAANAAYGGWTSEQILAARSMLRRLFEGPADFRVLRG
ncbi:MAG TPA: MmgE/PrpD family protein [Candidatus Binatia bacterium]|nr:MmgE/PrpD family protein [Candidatus Binatia bacterium]